MNYGTSATLEAAAVASSDVSNDISPVIGHLGKKKLTFRLGPKMRNRLTGGGGLPAAALLLSLPSAFTEAVVNMVSDVGREIGGVGMKTGTGFRQPMPRELEGEMAVMVDQLILENGCRKIRDRLISEEDIRNRSGQCAGRDTKQPDVASV